MNVTLGLVVIGEEGAPRWAASIHLDPGPGQRGRYCCDAGHHTPEAAAAHGSELAAASLGQYARSLRPPACGALALQAAA